MKKKIKRKVQYYILEFLLILFIMYNAKPVTWFSGLLIFLGLVALGVVMWHIAYRYDGYAKLSKAIEQRDDELVDMLSQRIRGNQMIMLGRNDPVGNAKIEGQDEAYQHVIDLITGVGSQSLRENQTFTRCPHCERLFILEMEKKNNGSGKN